jgi:hypothetical protein
MANEYAKCITLDNRFELSGLLSRNAAKAAIFAEKYRIPVVAKSMKELYERTKSEALIVTTPELATLEISLSAFNFPWTTLIEKPVGIDFEQSQTILDESNRTNAKAFVALNRRFYNSTVVAQDIMNMNQESRVIQINDQQDLIAARNLGQPERVLTNWMFANSLHIIDYINIFARGHVSKIHTSSKIINSSLFVHSNLTLSSGDFVSYFCVWNGPGGWSVNVRNHLNEVRLEPLERIWARKFPSRLLEEIPVPSHNGLKPGLTSLLDQFYLAIVGKKSLLPNLQASNDLMHLVKTIYGEINVPA